MTTLRSARIQGAAHLLICGLQDSASAEVLVSKIIDCCGKAKGRAGRVTVTPSAGDHCWSPADLDRIVAEVSPVLQAGDRVLIHCNSGRSRSSTAAAAVLLAMGLATTPDVALAATTLESSRTTPHRRAVQSLRDWWATKRQAQLF
jgi:hypothetical protein